MVKKATVLASIALIIILGFGVYSNSLNSTFFWDDKYLITDNRFIYDYSNIPRIFTKDTEAGSGGRSNFYRPLQILSYMFDYSLWKLDARGYHLTSITLHILVALCIYWLIHTLFKDWVFSLLVSIIFIVHPIHTVVVSYIATRADLLASLFILFSFIFYLKILQAQNLILYILMIFSYALALLSKENSLILPALILLYHFSFKEKIKLKAFVPIAGVAFIYVVLRTTLLKSMLSNVSYSTTLLQRLPGFFVAITNYLKLMVLPFDLHVEYGLPVFKFTHPQAILGIIILIVALFYLFKTRNTNRIFFFTASWFIVALLPQSNLYPINAYMSENWLYLPSIGFFFILAKCLSYLCELKKFFKPFALIFAIALLVFYSALTIKQNNYWKDPLLFYERTLKFAPNSQRVYNNLGNTYKEIGRPLEALQAYKKALEVDPNSKRAYNNLGVLYKDIGEYEESVKAYKKAIEIDVNYSEAYTNLGVAYKDMDKQTEAIASFKTAIEKNPDFAQAHNNLAALYITIGKDREAISLLEKAIKINSHYAEAYNNLAVAYYVKGDYAQAIQNCDRAAALGFKIHPKFLELLKQYRR